MNRLSQDEGTRVIQSLVEGNSVRATCRIVGVAKGTVLSLLAQIGTACAEHQDKTLRNLYSRRIQCDEVWSFCYAKEKNVPDASRGQFGYGDVWTWVALDADTKLVPSWYVGRRDAADASAFISDLASRLSNRVQLTTDGYRAYLVAVEQGFGSHVDYAMLVKLYGQEPQTEARYSPPKIMAVTASVIQGRPDPQHISTSFVERQNLTMRMGMRRFTRLTNGFSKKVENLQHALTLHFMHYNFCRVHKTLKMTPAMAAGVADHPWSVGEVIGLLSN